MGVRTRPLALFLLSASGACSASSGAPGAPPMQQAQDAGSTSGDADLPSTGDAGATSAPDSSMADATADAAADSGTASGTWSPVSYGITTKDTGQGDDIAIAYGGYTATMTDSQAWITQMQAVRLAQLGVGHLYAVQGPKDVTYSSREIGNSELATALATQATPAAHVIVIAHSSGGYVADELFTFADASVLSKITYFNLDGGSWALTNALVGSMRGVYFCNAHDSVAGDSENTPSDQQLHADFPASRYFTVDADGSGCDVGAGWCLHDTLITNHPHDPTTFDLALDYTDFTGTRQAVTSYVDQAVADGTL